MNQHKRSEKERRFKRTSEAYFELLSCIEGEDEYREGLIDTSQRATKAFTRLTSGYTTDLNKIVNNAIFEEDYDQMVIVKDIEFYSLCEHHLLPFFGKAHVAYVPAGSIIGLSKIPRIVDMYARRLQVQERFTRSIASALNEVISPEGVGVVVEGQHMCMMMRGVQKQNATMQTNMMTGVFRDDLNARQEFLSALEGK